MNLPRNPELSLADFAGLLDQVQGELRLGNAEICVAAREASPNTFHLPDTRLRDWKAAKKLPNREEFGFLVAGLTRKLNASTLPPTNIERIKPILKELKEVHHILSAQMPEMTKNYHRRQPEKKLWQVGLQDLMVRTNTSAEILARVAGLSPDLFNRWTKNELRTAEKSRYPAERQAEWLRTIAAYLRSQAPENDTATNHCNTMLIAFGQNMNASVKKKQR